MLEIHFYSICDRRGHTCGFEMGQGGVDIDGGHAVDYFCLGKLRLEMHSDGHLDVKFNLKSTLLLLFLFALFPFNIGPEYILTCLIFIYFYFSNSLTLGHSMLIVCCFF